MSQQSGAKAALQGFRLQALYILARILDPVSNELVFQPEGQEDLAIYNDDSLIESIQVKAHKAPLTISSFQPNKPHSFFHRAVTGSSKQDTCIKVVSFGPIGRELKNAWNGIEADQDSVLRKLKNHGIPASKAAFLFERTSFERASEERLLNTVLSFIKKTIAGGAPQQALNLLLWWIYEASEKRRKLRPNVVVNKINEVGRFINEQATHQLEWFNTIAPLDEAAKSKTYDALAEEYYQGVSARYQHISAGLDIIREANLDEIHNAYESGNQTIVIHGASGQGKTSLALRYLHDYVPDGWRYQVRIVQDRQQALRISTALASHLKAVEAPLFLYIDVTPRDLDWGELVRELQNEPNVRILISIRSEDLARQTMSDSELGNPRLINLEFSKEEASDIYPLLVEKGAVNAYPSFTDAWRHFGGKDSLLEFVYFLTQTSSLSDRINKQIQRLEEEVRKGQMSANEMLLLQACSIANAYEARIELPPLVKELKLTSPQRTLELFEEEYLVRFSQDKLYAEALHPIRSKTISKAMETPFTPWGHACQLVLKHIAEPDIGSFLLYAFSRRPKDAEPVFTELKKKKLTSWEGIAGISKALQWTGLRNYLNDNRQVINEAKEHFGDVWFFALNYNVGEVDLESAPLDAIYEKAPPETINLKNELRERQTPPDSIFTPLLDWLSSASSLPSLGESPSEWERFIETSFWATRHGYGELLSKCLNKENMMWAALNLPIKSVGSLFQSHLNSLQHFEDSTYEAIQKAAIDRFRDEFTIIKIEYNDGQVKAHFIISADTLNENSKGTHDEYSNPLHETTIARLNLLAYLHPTSTTFGTQGYGHNLPGFPLPHDETYKDGVKAAYIRSDMQANLNATFQAIEELNERPSTWTDYASNVLKMRRQALSALKKIISSANKYFSSGRPKNILANPTSNLFWKDFYRLTKSTPKLPRTAVDEWGFFSETKNTNDNEQVGLKNSPFQLTQYKELISSTRKYFGSLGNFASQAPDAVSINLFAGLIKSYDDNVIELAAKELNMNEHVRYLSVHNLHDAWQRLHCYQTTFRQQLGEFINGNELSALEKQETQCIKKAWAVWHEYIYNPLTRCGRIDILALKKMDSALSQVQARVDNRFDELSDKGWCASIINKCPPWKGQPAIWIRVETSSPYDVLQAYMDTREAFISGIGELDYSSLEYRAIDYHWHTAVIVPTCNGFSFNKKAWKIGSFEYSNSKDIRAPESTWMHVPIFLENSVLSALDIQFHESPTPFPWKRFQEVIGQIATRIGNTIALESLPDDLDDIGTDILENYIEENGDQLGTLIEEMYDLYSAAANRFSELPDNDSDVEEAKDILVEIADRIAMPADDGILDFQTMEQWYPLLLESVFALECLSFIDDNIY